MFYPVKNVFTAKAKMYEEPFVTKPDHLELSNGIAMYCVYAAWVPATDGAKKRTFMKTSRLNCVYGIRLSQTSKSRPPRLAAWLPGCMAACLAAWPADCKTSSGSGGHFGKLAQTGNVILHVNALLI